MFKCNKNRDSYIIPVFKIILCCILIPMLINRNHFIHISHPLLNLFVDIASCIVVVLSVLCIYLSVGEMLLLNDRRSSVKVDIETAIKNSKKYAIDSILSMLETSDIIEIQIYSNNKIIKLGASSDCYKGSSRFFDKKYYIDDSEDISIINLKERLINYATKGELCVLTIDGVAPRGTK